MRSYISGRLKRLAVSVALLSTTAGIVVGTTGVLASTAGLPLAASTACGCEFEPLPDDVVISGFMTAVLKGQDVPVINWRAETPVTADGCEGGSVVVRVEGENVLTKKAESKEVTLSEVEATEFAGTIPIMYPVHGKVIVKIIVKGCKHASEEVVYEFECYCDPSGKVVDGNHEDAPVWEATVTLLASETEAGTYTAVPNGSEVMSPMNRVNPDKTRENGAFGWDVLEGYYKVEASKTGCGTATTSAFHVPPPVDSLELVLHCEGEQWAIGEAIEEKPQLAITAPAKACEGSVRVENVSFGAATIKVLKETGIECTIKKKGCEAKELKKAESCESELEKPGTKPEYELEVEWKGKKYIKKFSV